jgi:serine/threonine protein kinase
VSISTLVLEFVDGPEKGRTARISDFRPVLVGRGREAEIRMPASDETLSRRQVYIELSPQYCLLKRIAGSSDVVRVNHKKVDEQCVLTEGDLIRLGTTTLRVALDTSDNRCLFCDAAVEEPAQDGHDDCGDVSVYAHEICIQSDASSEERLGPYELCGVVATGAGRPVYRAYERSARRIWAVTRFADERQAQRFAFEICDRQAYRHPGILRYMHANVDQRGIPYVVTEYAREGILAEFCRRLPADVRTSTLVDAMEDVLDTLDFIHQSGRVHGDLTPSSMVVQRTRTFDATNRYQAKLAHPGVEPSSRHDIQSGSRSSTAPVRPFAAPEQLDGRHADWRSDVYSTGVSMYFLLSGRLPFRFVDDDLDRLSIEEVRHGERVPLRSWRPDLEPLLAQTIDRACHKDPDRRFDSARAFQEGLRRAAAAVERP